MSGNILAVGASHELATIKPDSNLRRLHVDGVSSILRWSYIDTIAGKTLIDTEDLLGLAELQRSHLDRLQDYDIRIPTYSSFIASAPTNVSVPALFNVVEAIDIVDRKTKSPKQCHKIGKALLGYLDWVKSSRQPLYLDDIYSPHQFGVDLDEQTWLLDIEPSFSSPDKPLIALTPNITRLDVSKDNVYRILDRAPSL
jgi:hypothetical protein